MESSLPIRVKKCSRCRQEYPVTYFYRRTNRPGGYGGNCRRCATESRVEQIRRNKEKAVEMLGGKCLRCGYNKCLDALCFHHPDPSKKDDMFKRLRNRKWDYIKQELVRQECVLLCANCHAETHSGGSSLLSKSQEDPSVNRTIE
jgi:hypothetical protein